MIDIIDPNTIPQSMEPTIWFCNENDFIAEAIDWRTDIKGIHPWNHAMLSINQGHFVCQSMGIFNAYKQGPMSTYMVKGTQLGCVKLVNNNPQFASAFAKSVQARLTAPWWVTQYDYLGILGQAIGVPEIHTPGLEYCSVDVIRHLVAACPMLPKSDQLVINAIPRETNPEKLWQIILNNPQTFNFYGQWSYTNGIALP